MIKIGLGKGSSLIRGVKKSLTQDQQAYVAETIVRREHDGLSALLGGNACRVTRKALVA
jgi:hypothetical protein